MVKGFALITVAPNKEKDVYERVKEIDGVSEAYMLAGEYDIITKLESNDTKTMGRVVIDRIRTIDGVLVTKTLCTFNSKEFRLG